MSIPLKPFGMSRREFLQVTGGSLLHSTLATRTTWAAADEDVTFVSDGLSLTLHFPAGSAAQLRSLRNPNTGFEWVRAENSLEPVFEAVGETISEMDIIARRTHAPGHR